jgi:hypothetical protein
MDGTLVHAGQFGAAASRHFVLIPVGAG